jgi:hypothetical protein
VIKLSLVTFWWLLKVVVPFVLLYVGMHVTASLFIPNLPSSIYHTIATIAVIFGIVSVCHERFVEKR